MEGMIIRGKFPEVSVFGKNRVEKGEASEEGKRKRGKTLIMFYMINYRVKPGERQREKLRGGGGGGGGHSPSTNSVNSEIQKVTNPPQTPPTQTTHTKKNQKPQKKEAHQEKNKK